MWQDKCLVIRDDGKGMILKRSSQKVVTLFYRRFLYMRSWKLDGLAKSIYK